MQKTIKALTLASVLAFAQAAWAGNENGGHNNNGNGNGGHNNNGPTITHTNTNGPTTNNTVLTQGQQQQQGQTQGQTATGIGTGIATSTSTSGAISGSNATAATGPITNGATPSTGPISNDSSATALGGTSLSTATGGTSSATGGTSNATGGTSNATGGNATGGNAAGGTSNASTGAVNVAPQQSTVNNFRSFVGTHAPNLSGSVDNCLAVLGWSAAVNVFGATGVGIGGGNQRTEYVEQCAAVKSAFEVWNRANGDVNKETFALDLLIKALPTYGKPAMDSAVERINSYIEQNGDQEPDSVMNIFGAKAFRKKDAAATQAPAPVVPAPVPAAPANLTVVVNPVVLTKEIRVIVGAQKKADQPAKKPDCGCKP